MNITEFYNRLSLINNKICMYDGPCVCKPNYDTFVYYDSGTGSKHEIEVPSLPYLKIKDYRFIVSNIEQFKYLYCLMTSFNYGPEFYNFHRSYSIDDYLELFKKFKYFGCYFRLDSMSITLQTHIIKDDNDLKDYIGNQSVYTKIIKLEG